MLKTYLTRPKQHRQQYPNFSVHQGKMPSAPSTGANPVTSALRVQNFGALADVAGLGNLGACVQLPLSRIEELLKGVNFSNEVTHHIETTLQLSSGFLDRVNPKLSEDTIHLLKNPENLESEEDDSLSSSLATLPAPKSIAAPAVASQAPAAVAMTPSLPAPSAVPPVSSSDTQISLELSVTPEPQPSEPVQPKKTISAATPEEPVVAERPLPQQAAKPLEPFGAAGSPLIVIKRSKLYTPPETISAPITSAPVTLKEPQMSEAATAEKPPVEAPHNVRLHNLQLLTQPAGAKSALSRLLNTTAATVSNKLHGRSAISDDDVVKICNSLDLPAGWMDGLHTSFDVPESAIAILNGNKAPALTPKTSTDTKPRRVKKGEDLAPTLAQAAAATAPSSASLNTPSGASAGSELGAENASPVSSGLFNIVSSDSRSTPPAVKKPSKVPVLMTDLPTSTPAQPAAQASNAVTQALAEAGSVGPVAEALLRTLAMKAREGKLTEQGALKLLNEAVAL